MSGGGGGGQYYGNLDRLYGEQADNAAQLRGESQKTFEDMGQLRQMAQNYGSQANQDKLAANATADARMGLAQQQQQMRDEMASMGINPADERYARQFRTMGVQGAAQVAGSANSARERGEQQGWARMADVTSMGLGLPGQATQALNSAGNMATSQINAAQQQSANQSANIAGAVRGGMDLYGMLAKDGGYIHLKGGGYVDAKKYARGGVVGAMSAGMQPPPPPMGAPQQPSAAGQAGRGMLKLGPAKVGQGIMKAGNALGSEGMSEFGAGMADPSTAYQMAGQQVDTAASQLGMAAGESSNAALGSSTADMLAAAGAAPGEAAAAGGALAESAAAVGGEAAAGAMGGLGTAGAAIGTAMPWIGGAMLLGSALGLFRDGGAVTPGSNGEHGGKVAGPGGPKDDKVPAMLSDGEFVLPVGTVKKYGLAKLEKMRQEGLEFEQQLGIV